MFIAVKDFLNLALDTSNLGITIFDVQTDKTLWTGNADDVPAEYMGMPISTFDPPEEDKLTLNIMSLYG